MKCDPGVETNAGTRPQLKVNEKGIHWWWCHFKVPFEPLQETVPLHHLILLEAVLIPEHYWNLTLSLENNDITCFSRCTKQELNDTAEQSRRGLFVKLFFFLIFWQLFFWGRAFTSGGNVNLTNCGGQEVAIGFCVFSICSKHIKSDEDFGN